MACEGGGSNNRSNSYYNVLGIRKDASVSDIRTAYRKLAMVLDTYTYILCNLKYICNMDQNTMLSR